MATPIKKLAGRIMDLYYQDYAASTEFFDIDDFVFYVGSTYADLLQKEYDTERQIIRAGREEGYVTFSHDWLQTQVLKKQKKDGEGDFYLLAQKPMSFPFDKWDIGIQDIFAVGSQYNGQLIRDSIDKSWQNDLLPLTKNVYWSLIGDRIIVKKSLREAPAEIRVVYVPEISPNLEIPNSKDSTISTLVLALMRGMENNHLVKETNDQNKNKLPITENDRQLIK